MDKDNHIGNEDLNKEVEKLKDLIGYIMIRENIKYIEKDGESYNIKGYDSIQDIIQENKRLKRQIKNLKRGPNVVNEQS